jgi:hypothetical protein
MISRNESAGDKLTCALAFCLIAHFAFGSRSFHNAGSSVCLTETVIRSPPEFVIGPAFSRMAEAI